MFWTGNEPTIDNAAAIAIKDTERIANEAAPIIVDVFAITNAPDKASITKLKETAAVSIWLIGNVANTCSWLPIASIETIIIPIAPIFATVIVFDAKDNEPPIATIHIANADPAEIMPAMPTVSIKADNSDNS